jgi:hypothetical protein
LEPDTWERRYVRTQGRRRPTETDQTVLTAADWELCLRLRDAIWNHPTCQDLLSEGTAESSAWWLDPETQLLCKCRPDWSRTGLLLDFKTARDASPAGFARAVERYRYHVQAVYALDGWQAAGGDPLQHFLLVAMEKTPPFAVALYELPATALATGRALYRRDLATVSDCLRQQHWPGYPTAIVTLAMDDGRPAPGILF